MTDTIVHVPFYDDPLEAVQRDDGVWLGVKRACENVWLLDAVIKKLCKEGA